MTPKVSVIMPSFNMVVYIEQALKSVCQQTLKDIEILCIDANSTDGTAEIIQRYTKNDNRIRYISVSVSSYGYQMNLGIQEANGEYIGIVETDDYVDEHMFERLYETALKTNAQIVKSNFDLFFLDDTGNEVSLSYILNRHHRVEYNQLYSCQAYISGKYTVECYIWNAIYEKKFLKDYNIMFQETSRAAFQDFSFKYQVNLIAERIVAIQDVLYHYRRDNRLSSTYNPRSAEFNYGEACFLYNKMRDRIVNDNYLYQAIAREIEKYAFGPFFEVNCWQTPSEGSKAAFYGYRDLFSKFLVDGALQQEMLHPWEWEQISFLLEDADFYLQYVEMAARIKAKEILAFIGMLKKTKRLYVFGSGFYGKAVAVFLLSNQIDSFVGFVDNDPNKQEKEIYHKQVLAVNDAVKKGTDSFFVLPPGRHKDAMRDQLLRLGVPKENVLEYTLDTSPIFCTNYMIMKRSEGGNKL